MLDIRRHPLPGRKRWNKQWRQGILGNQQCCFYWNIILEAVSPMISYLIARIVCGGSNKNFMFDGFTFPCYDQLISQWPLGRCCWIGTDPTWRRAQPIVWEGAWWHPEVSLTCLTKHTPWWWFQVFFIFTPTWGRFPFWPIFFKEVETTN